MAKAAFCNPVIFSILYCGKKIKSLETAKPKLCRFNFFKQHKKNSNLNQHKKLLFNEILL